VEESEQQDARADAAREHFTRARQLYNEGKHAASILELRRAHELRPSPKIIRTIAEIAEEMRDYATSLQAWRRYQSEMGDRVDATERQHVAARVRALQGQVSELTIDGGEPGARVFVDDEPIGTLPLLEPTLLNAGRHTIRVHKEGFAPFSQVVTVAGRDPVRLQVILERMDRTPAGSPVQGPSPAASDAGKGRMTKLSWIGYGSAAALGAAGAVTGVLALSADRRSRDQAFAGFEPPARMTEDLRDARRLGLATDVLVGAAITTALVTTYFTWIHPSGHRKSDREVRVGVGPGQAWIGGAF